MIKHPILTSERLVLRPVQPEDDAHLHLVYSDPAAMRFMETPPHSKLSETHAKIDQMRQGEACYWSILLKETNTAIGNVGYLGNEGVPGMGYILHSDFWRQGLMTEAVQAAVAYGFQQMGLDRIELWINDDNIASQKLAHKVGFTRRGRFRMKYPHQQEAHDKWVYGLYRHEWGNPAENAHPPSQQIYSLQPVLQVKDVKKTAEYYRDFLGFKIDFFYGDPPSHGAVSCGEWMSEGARIQLSQEDNPPAGKDAVELYLFVGADIDDRYQLYLDRGVPVVREINTFPWGMREFIVKDPNGFILRFGTPA